MFINHVFSEATRDLQEQPAYTIVSLPAEDLARITDMDEGARATLPALKVR